MEFDLIRCLNCGKLSYDAVILEGRGCSCGNTLRFTPSKPNNILEEIKVLWWTILIIVGVTKHEQGQA